MAIKLPDNRNATAGNGGGSENFKASDLLLSSLAAGTDFTAEDRHAAFVAGYEQGKAERVEIEIQAQVQARLHQISLEALGMARRLARVKGPAWSALITECGVLDD